LLNALEAARQHHDVGGFSKYDNQSAERLPIMHGDFGCVISQDRADHGARGARAVHQRG
jgi:hypothetical protein